MKKLLVLSIIAVVSLFFVPVSSSCQQTDLVTVLAVYPPNQDYRSYHLNTERLTDEQSIYIYDVETAKKFKGNTKIKVLAEKLISINGVTQVIIYKHSIHFEKDQAFSWEQIQPKVLEALKKYLSPKTMVLKENDQRETYKTVKNGKKNDV